jgi:hypothetical protein
MGFALIELPLVLFILAVLGLLAVLAFRLIQGPVPWYAWPLGFFALPALALALCILAMREVRNSREGPKGQARKW